MALYIAAFLVFVVVSYLVLRVRKSRNIKAAACVFELERLSDPFSRQWFHESLVKILPDSFTIVKRTELGAILDYLVRAEAEILSKETFELQRLECRKLVATEMDIWRLWMFGAHMENEERLEQLFSKHFTEIGPKGDEHRMNLWKLYALTKAQAALMKACSLRLYGGTKFFDASSHDWFYGIYAVNDTISKMLNKYSKSFDNHELFYDCFNSMDEITENYSKVFLSYDPRANTADKVAEVVTELTRTDHNLAS